MRSSGQVREAVTQLQRGQVGRQHYTFKERIDKPVHISFITVLFTTLKTALHLVYLVSVFLVTPTP
jgi:hypothetical protein